ncbi:MAG: DUF58 domain-containing protein [Phycisphaerae bacterium]
MPTSANEYRKYLDPRTLAKVSSLELRARLIVEGMMTGMHKSPFQGSSVEFAQHRAYVAGDDTRHIDWKVFGRSDRLMVKQYQEETNLPLILAVDASQSMSFSSLESIDAPGESWTKFDHATAVAGTLAYMAVNQSDAVGLAIFDESLVRYYKPSNNPRQWRFICGEMQGIPRWNKTGVAQSLEALTEKLGRRSVVMLLSDFFGDIDAIKRGLRTLAYKKHEIVAVQIMDPQELTFPFEDVTLFKGMEEMGELLTEPRALREAYMEQVRQHNEAIDKLCRSMNIDYRLFNSGDPLDVELSSFLANRLASIRAS